MDSDGREIAFYALMEWHKRGAFLWDSLERLKARYDIEARDLNFAYELACGSLRQLRLLDGVVGQVAKMPKKIEQRMLLRIGLYMRLFCPNIPLYAVVNSLVELAKKKCHPSCAPFLNAVLRKEFTIPKCHSFTDFFIEAISQQYGEEKKEAIFEQFNQPCPLFSVAYGKENYIQNRTQLELLTEQAKRVRAVPKTILDLCAAPGGKSLALHRLFPNAKLVSNDISPKKMALLKENFDRCGCPAESVCHDGTTHLWPAPFDLVVVDAPCSNSGVLYKCPEARWRIEKAEIEALNRTQLALLKGAEQNLAAGGTIWYQTCSILQQENEELVKKSGLQVAGTPILQLPDAEGHEGGFSCALIIN